MVAAAVLSIERISVERTTARTKPSICARSTFAPTIPSDIGTPSNTSRRRNMIGRAFGRNFRTDRGLVGLWTGNNSDGDFANLRITTK